MIEIPIGKALAAVEVEKADVSTLTCEGCFYENQCQHKLACIPPRRKDNKNVIFKLVDWPGEAQAKMRPSARDVLDRLAYHAGKLAEASDPALRHND